MHYCNNKISLPQTAGVETVSVEDDNWRSDTRGLPGQEMTLHLLLRVVADVGIVGFPNAGGRGGWVAGGVLGWQVGWVGWVYCPAKRMTTGACEWMWALFAFLTQMVRVAGW